MATCWVEGHPDLAVADVYKSAFGHADQKCSAASLMILVGSVGKSERFINQLVDATRSLKVGKGEARGSDAWSPHALRSRRISAALRVYAMLAMSADVGAVRDLSKRHLIRGFFAESDTLVNKAALFS